MVVCYLPVKRSLCWAGLLFDGRIRFTLRWLVESRRRTAIFAERSNSRRCGQAGIVPMPFCFPPKPPAPRMKTVDWLSKITFPVALSLVCTMDVTAAALPLSRTSRSLGPSRGISFWCSKHNTRPLLYIPRFAHKVSFDRDRGFDSKVLFTMQ